MAGLIKFEIIRDHIALLTFNRPDKMNALSSALLEEFHEHLFTIENHPDVRVLIITGSGEKAFCAGADLKERRTMNKEATIQSVKRIGETFERVSKLSIPVIAAINGAAFGGGLELALACDIRLFARNAKTGLTETSLGIIPGAGGTQRLGRLIGIGHAKRMIFTAKPIDAEEAYYLGLAEKLTDKDSLMTEALTMAEQISKNGPFAIKQAKASINKGIEIDLHTALEMEHLYYLQTIPTEDREEGLKAFEEKRQPKYLGR